MNLDRTAGRNGRIRQRNVVFRRAHRAAMERGQHRPAIVAISADVEDKHEGEQRKSNAAKAALTQRQWQGAPRPAEPGSVSEAGVAAQ